MSVNEKILSRCTGDSFADRAALRVRARMYQKLAEVVPLLEMQNVLDVGVTADQSASSSNFFEYHYPHAERITALSDQDAHWMEVEFPGLKFVRGNALDLPFPDNAFDLVISNAVIEHVGSSENQRKFLAECFRVSRKHVFITTPNRFHPVEFHTILPFIHWLPKRVHRGILKSLGMPFFASENNLNLLTKKELMAMANEVLSISTQTSSPIHTQHIVPEIVLAWFMGFPSNLLLFMQKA
jgi:ubiquinone/menaquinone biosynthesis C-methylase UbiE